MTLMKAKKILHPTNMDYENIQAFPNDCTLY